ncbi:MAG: hypothetical protein HC837_05590 [Chloroflexaceae bacterium]|nr:hypothetical protein [Chloroflexaceae bacterium]
MGKAKEKRRVIHRVWFVLVRYRKAFPSTLTGGDSTWEASADLSMFQNETMLARLLAPLRNGEPPPRQPDVCLCCGIHQAHALKTVRVVWAFLLVTFPLYDRYLEP